MVAQRDLEALLERSRFMRDSLCKSQNITDSMITILGSFDHRLSDLETAMRPTQVHTHAIRKARENIDNTLKVAENILAQFDVSRKVESKIAAGPHEDLGGYLAAVDELRDNVEFFTYNNSFKSSDSALNHAHGLLSKAMVKLEEEFRDLLTLHSKPQEPAKLIECLPNSVRSNSPGTQGDGEEKGLPQIATNGKHVKGLEGVGSLIPTKVIPQLHELAQRMITAGHHQQCCKIYRTVRASVLEQTLQQLGVEKLSREDIYKMQWDVLDGKITSWIQFMRIAVKLLFSSERKLCDQVFHGLEPYRETCFSEVTGNSVTMLLTFGESIAKSKRSPEKLFVLLDMYETMRELFPEVEIIFGGKPSASICEAVSGLTQRLAQTAEETFNDFADAVEKDVTKTPVQDGTVHPLTSYVINYVKFLFDYQVTLRQLFGEDEMVEPAKSQLAAATVKIMAALQTNLDGKSKLYRDPALAHVFLMNNIHYMVKSVRRSEAKDVLGEDWVQRHRRIVQQHAQNYKRVAWSKVLQSLSVQGLTSSGSGLGNEGSMSTGVSRTMLKDRFKTFNFQFEELYRSSVFPIQNDYFVCSQSSSEYEFPPISTSTISRQREREDSSGSCDALVSVDSQIEAKEGVTCVQPGLVLPIAKAIDSKESADLIAYAPRISFNDSNSERDRAHQMIASECSDARSVEQFNMEGHHYCMHRSQMLGDENDSCNMDDATRGNEKAKDLGCGPHVPTLSRTVMDTQCGLDTGSASHGSQDDLIGVSGEPTDEVVDSLDVKGNIIRILNSCHFRTVTYTSWLWNHLIRWQVQFGYANTLWSVALAAAVMGLFVLGRSWHHLQVQNRSLRTRLRAKEKRIIQLMFQLAQMRDSLSKAHQVPVICMKPSLHT